MIGNKLERDIIAIFYRDISTLLSINQIAKVLKKSYPNINRKVNELIEEGVLKKTEVGRSHLCYINLESEKAIALLMLHEADRRLHAPKIDLTRITSRFKIYTIVYAKKSLYFVLDHIYDKAAISQMLKYKDCKFFTVEGFQDYVKHNPQDFRHKIVLYSAQKYYEIIREILSPLIAEALIR